MLILKIAENADPNSGITLDALLDAHGMVPINAEKAKKKLMNYIFNVLNVQECYCLKN